MKNFVMQRENDKSGVSGVGVVLEGTVFSNGKTVVTWLGKSDVQVKSLGIFDSYEDFLSVHVTSHPENITNIIWSDDPEYPQG